MRRVGGYQFILLRQFKIGKVETGANGAAHQGIFATRRQPAGKPVAGCYHTLKAFIIIRVAAKAVFYHLALLIYFIYDQRIAIIEMPYFIAFYFMKSREL